MRYSRVQVMMIYRRADGWTSGRERNHQENLLGGILYYGPLRLGGGREGGTGRSSVEVGGESSKGDNTGYHYCQSIMARLQGSYSVQSYSSANRSRGFSFPIFFFCPVLLFLLFSPLTPAEEWSLLDGYWFRLYTVVVLRCCRHS